MTNADRDALRDTLTDAHTLAKRAVERVKECGGLDGRKCAIALTEIEKGFAMAQLAVTEAP